MEAYIAKKIHIYLESRPILSRRWKEIDPEDYKVGDGFMRSKKQLSLLKTLKNNNIIILNGPAGTGKSATITEVIEVAKDLKLSVELMAPTGKADKSPRGIYRLASINHPSWIMLYENGRSWKV